MIRTENLTVIYPGRLEAAVNNLNLNIDCGDFFGLIGPNGAGKTTIISVISSLIKPTDGRVFINGKDINNSLSEVKNIFGIVPQEIALYDKLTVYENLKYYGSLFGIKRVALNSRIDFLLARLNLLHYKHHKIKNLSGGMKKRINLAAGILHDPEIIILDEPVVGLDVQSKKLVREFLKELNLQEKTILYTSHIMEDIEKMCNKTAIIDYGKITDKGSPAELINKHKDCNNLEEVFLKLTGQKTRD